MGQLARVPFLVWNATPVSLFLCTVAMPANIYLYILSVKRYFKLCLTACTQVVDGELARAERAFELTVKDAFECGNVKFGAAPWADNSVVHHSTSRIQKTKPCFSVMRANRFPKAVRK